MILSMIRGFAMIENMATLASLQWVVIVLGLRER